ncbi:MAG: TIGR04211 family SH3 domain-containing protein [Desulfobacula sp.]|nr:TIGR04211 family SH3 domain-containing protein [Desulfobacula sp.]
MRKYYQYCVIILLCMVFFACPLLAEDIYVKGITNITMRTGPGVEHKIVVMVKSGTKLEIIEYQKDWTQVKADSGRTGWVLSRFLTQEIPGALLVDKLRKKNSNILSKLEAVETKNKKLVDKNILLTLVQEKYNKLKQESADFLKLDAEYKKISKQFEIQKNQIKELNNSLDNEEKLWFLSGGGVFIVGLFFGLSMRKKKRSSLL